LDSTTNGSALRLPPRDISVRDPKAAFDTFNCAYPRLLRQIIHKNPSSQATVFTSKGDFTLFHRNVERAVWLARQNGFEEGPKADEEERTRLLQRKRDGRPRKHVTTPHMTKTYTPP